MNNEMTSYPEPRFDSLPRPVDHVPERRTAAGRVVNRHMARLLTNLAEAGASVLIINAVRSELQWLRADLDLL